MLETLSHLNQRGFPSLTRQGVEILQVNLGYLCNLQCQHCHVDAGPKRTEVMDGETIGQIIELLEQGGISTLDLTGGAPEMNPHFKKLVGEAHGLGVKVIDRCNLAILEESYEKGMAEYLAEKRVDIVASLPCYLEENVNAQRGDGTFEKSIDALKRLNKLGYGKESGLVLNLVYNPQGATLPPSQQALEQNYRKQLNDRFGIVFNQLLTITNMPIRRFGSMLLSTNQFEDYMQTLQDAYQSSNLDAVMCRSLVSVDWKGFVYDCDFNQMLDLPMRHTDRTRQGRRIHITDLAWVNLCGKSVVVRDHCYGCTAGQGSSCGGALD
jgi:radical SAM/Cys-rich protein